MPHKKQQQRPVIYVFFGMIATGKTSLSEAWARYKNLNFYNSDRVRKELAGIDPTENRREGVDTGIYTQEFSRKTYKVLLDKAESLVNKGDSVVIDGSYQRAHDRQAISRLAQNVGAEVYFIFCHCPEAEMKRRMELRQKDAAAVSDGRWEIYLKQKQRFEPPEEIPPSRLIVIKTDASVDELLEQLKKKLP